MSRAKKKPPLEQQEARYGPTWRLDAKVRALAERGVPFSAEAYREAVKEEKRR